ncbi:hypothetical protein H2248_003304 [Termitomyces sp. 'cryptogamus']|nr:hypothetical protein H2248_003304 [Termitomyces sp. 'cryptogamus']
MGPEICYDIYHIEVVKSSPTRSLAERFPDVQNGVATPRPEKYIPTTKDGPNNLLPTPGFAGQYLTNVESQIQRAIAYPCPTIEGLDKETEIGPERGEVIHSFVPQDGQT